MKLLVTGCAGFIASKTTELLLEAGHDVVGVDNLNDAYDRRLKDWRLALLTPQKNFEFHKIDIADLKALRPIFEKHKFDAVVNLAARAGVRQSILTPHVYVDTNMTGSLNLLECCKDFGVNKYLLASTSSLYGSHNTTPFSETANTDRPLSPYAASKKGAESLSATYHHLYKLDTPIVRYFTVYGPAGRPDMSVLRFIRWIAQGQPIVVYGDGSQERDFTYIDDIARGTIAALQVKGFEIINLGGDQPAKLKEMIETIEKHLGQKSRLEHKPFHPADMQATWADISKAKKMLKWEPQISLDEGIKKSVDWYLKNRQLVDSLDLGSV